MKKISSFLFFWVFSLAVIKAQINFALDYASFHSPAEKPYMEFYLSVNGNSISYAEGQENIFQAKLEVTYIIEAQGEVKSFEKFQIKSPEYALEDIKLDLMDLKRIPIENGEYSLSIKIKDLISSVEVEKTTPLPKIDYNDNSISISQIQLANSVVQSENQNAFVKSGIEVIPNISHVFGNTQNMLSFYVEVYHSNKTLGDNNAYLLEYKIIDEKTSEVAANLRGIKRMTSSKISPYTQTFNLQDLASGNYLLEVNAINQNNEVIAKNSTSFFRNNPDLKNITKVNYKNTFVDSITNTDLLAEYIRSLRPISTSEELAFGENQINYNDLEFMQKYFYNFWLVRNQTNPEDEWLEYKKQLAIVDKEFGYGNIKGYQTERGRVYLQYGPPNSVQDVPYESETYPYSIWQYYKLQGLTDRKIIFYSPSMEMLGYEVLHSNIRGEIYNPGWEIDLINKTNGGRRSNREDPTEQNVIVNPNSRMLFDNPR